jgi:hypothetical protein
MFTNIFDVPCLTKIVTFEYKTHKLEHSKATPYVFQLTNVPAERVTHQAASIYP